jgi:hypothetical protein
MADLMRSFHLLKKAAAAGTLDEESRKTWNIVLNKQENGKALVQRYCLVKNGPAIHGLLRQAYDSWKQHGKITMSKQETKPNE